MVDAYALIGDVSGLAEKIQSFFMQEVISETHSVLKSIVLEVWIYMTHAMNNKYYCNYIYIHIFLPEPNDPAGTDINLIANHYNLMTWEPEKGNISCYLDPEPMIYSFLYKLPNALSFCGHMGGAEARMSNTLVRLLWMYIAIYWSRFHVRKYANACTSNLIFASGICETRCALT